MATSVQADNWCYTKMQVDRYTYLWKIDNFSYCREETGETMKSSIFSTGPDKLQWCMRVNPRGLDDESKEHLSLYLLLVQSTKKEVRAKFKFSILNDNAEEVRAMESQRAYRFVQGKDWGFKKFVRRDALVDASNGYLVNDVLTLFCEINIVSDPVTLDGRSSFDQINVPSCTLALDLENLLKSKKFADVTFQIGEVTLQAHKAILASRSSVFDAMFKHNMEEQQQGKVNISDIEADVFEEMLKYIYTGQAPQRLDDFAAELLAAADKYDLERLKCMCENSMSNNLLVENAVKVLVIADMYRADILKKNVLEFIKSYASEVLETDGYKNLQENHPRLVKEAFCVLARSCSKDSTFFPARKKARTS